MTRSKPKGSKFALKERMPTWMSLRLRRMLSGSCLGRVRVRVRVSVRVGVRVRVSSRAAA